jgi:hypothetical protein
MFIDGKNIGSVSRGEQAGMQAVYSEVPIDASSTYSGKLTRGRKKVFLSIEYTDSLFEDKNFDYIDGFFEGLDSEWALVRKAMEDRARAEHGWKPASERNASACDNSSTGPRIHVSPETRLRAEDDGDTRKP